MYQRKRNFSIRNDDLIYDIMREHQNLSGIFSPLVDRMTKLFDFTCAELQWDETVKNKIKSEGRPANSYNLIRTILNVIFSVELENRKQGIARPRTSGDTELAHILTKVLKYYMYHARFNKAQKIVFMDAVIAIFGVYYVGWDFRGDDEVGKLVVEPCDPREFMFEPNFADTTWGNAGYVMRKHSMSVEEILNRYALNDSEMQEQIIEEAKQFYDQDGVSKDKFITRRLKALFSAVYETAMGFSSSNDNVYSNHLQWFDPRTGKFDVLEYHEQRTERKLMVMNNEETSLYDITDPYISMVKSRNDKFSFDGFRFDDNEAVQAVKEKYQLIKEPKIELVTRRYVTASVPSFRTIVNEKAYPFESDYYCYIPQYCYDLHADPLKSQSVMDDLLDPQSHFNKAQSLKLELLGRYLNKGWIMDENAIDGLEDDWTTQRIAPYRRVRAGYLNMIRPEEGQTISPDLVRDPIETQQLMKVISNADDEIRGQQGSDVKSGKHFIAKEQRQSKSFSYILDNRDHSQRAVYELAVSFIQHFVTTQKVYRITQDEIPEINGVEEVTVNQSRFGIDQNTGRIIETIVNDLDSVKFDIELSDEPYSLSAQEDRYRKLGDVFNAALEVDPRKADAMLPILVEESNTPSADKILKAWKALEAPNPQQVQMQQLMMQVQQIMAKLGVEEKQEEIKDKKLRNLETVQRMRHASKNSVLGMLQKPQMTN